MLISGVYGFIFMHISVFVCFEHVNTFLRANGKFGSTEEKGSRHRRGTGN